MLLKGRLRYDDALSFHPTGRESVAEAVRATAHARWRLLERARASSGSRMKLNELVLEGVDQEVGYSVEAAFADGKGRTVRISQYTVPTDGRDAILPHRFKLVL